MLTVATARFFSDGVDIYLRCTSGFVDDVLLSYDRVNWPESSTMSRFGVVRQVAIPVGRQTTTAFGKLYQNAAREAKSVIYDLFVR